MRKILLATALFAAAIPSYALDKQGLMDAYFSVMMIRGYDANGGMAYGSGVVVGDNKVITNCHVLRKTKKPWISHGEDNYAITGVKVDAWHDLCLVSTYLLPFKPVKLGKSSNLKRGQEVAGIGHSNGVPAPLTSNGSVKALYLEKPGDDAKSGLVIRTTAKFLMGASGSGLFDMDGNLVGINTFKTKGSGGSVHYALPIEWLAEIEKKPEITEFPVSGKALWEEDEDKKPYYMQVAVPESREEWQKLVDVSQKWTVAEPKNSEAWYELGLAYEKLTKNDEAVAAYKQAVALDGGNFDALFHLGVIAKGKNDMAEVRRIHLAINEIDKDLANEYSEIMGCEKQC
jgi:serine protease Do